MTTPAAGTPTTPAAPVTPPTGTPPVAGDGVAPPSGGTTPGTPPAPAAGEATTPAGQGTQTQQGAGGDPTKGAPADYELKAPEGQQVEAAALKAFATEAKAMGLSAEHAQKLVDYQVKASAAAQAEADAAANAAWEATTKQWDADIRADAELGGAAFEANRDVATKAIARFGGPKLVEYLEKTGLGRYPEFQRFCLRAGKAIAEDSLAGSHGSTVDGTKPTAAQLLYPSSSAPKE